MCKNSALEKGQKLWASTAQRKRDDNLYGNEI